MSVNPPPGEGRPYHHGSLAAALIEAARRILERDGVAALTLRAAAREAGVSHAAPKNHFGGLAGLLSEVAAAGFVQLRDDIIASSGGADTPSVRLHAIGAAYVRFALAHPAVFLLMFRRERLDPGRPALGRSASALLAVLASATGNAPGPDAALEEGDAAEMVKAWSLVHGLAMLLIDGRLGPILDRLPVSEEAFVARLLGAPPVQG